MCMKGILKQRLNYHYKICKQDNANEPCSISTLFWHKPHSSRQKINEIRYKQTLTCVHWNEVVLNFAVSVICCLFSESLVIRCGHWLSIQGNQTQANVWRGQKQKINLLHHYAFRLWQISRPWRLLTRDQMFIRLWIFNPLDIRSLSTIVIFVKRFRVHVRSCYYHEVTPVHRLSAFCKIQQILQ